jgi:hypothetical protein
MKFSKLSLKKKKFSIGDNEIEVPIIPNNISIASAGMSLFGYDFEFLTDLNTARQTENAYLIFEGDYGGDVYLTVPVKDVKCDENAIYFLLKDLDSIAWQCNKGGGRTAYYEIRKVGDITPNWGQIKEKLWISPTSIKYEKDIVKVLSGKRERIKHYPIIQAKIEWELFKIKCRIEAIKKYGIKKVVISIINNFLGHRD